MSYLVSVFDTFYNMTNIIQIPIPITTNSVIMIPLFTIIYSFIVFGIIFWAISKLFGFEFSFAKNVANHYALKNVYSGIDKNIANKEGEKRSEFLRDKRNKKEK